MATWQAVRAPFWDEICSSGGGPRPPFEPGVVQKTGSSHADGLGQSYCAPDFQEANLHSYCVAPEDVPEGSEPCIWWLKGTANDDETHCWYKPVCAPEGMLAELGWPEDAGFDFHLGCGGDVCDSSTWPENVEIE